MNADEYFVLHRKELRGWDWVETLPEGMTFKDRDDTGWTVWCYEGGEKHLLSEMGESRDKPSDDISDFSPSTCKVLFEGIRETEKE